MKQLLFQNVCNNVQGANKPLKLLAYNISICYKLSSDIMVQSILAVHVTSESLLKGDAKSSLISIRSSLHSAEKSTFVKLPCFFLQFLYDINIYMVSLTLYFVKKNALYFGHAKKKIVQRMGEIKNKTSSSMQLNHCFSSFRNK